MQTATVSMGCDAAQHMDIQVQAPLPSAIEVPPALRPRAQPEPLADARAFPSHGPEATARRKKFANTRKKFEDAGFSGDQLQQKVNDVMAAYVYRKRTSAVDAVADPSGRCLPVLRTLTSMSKYTCMLNFKQLFIPGSSPRFEIVTYFKHVCTMGFSARPEIFDLYHPRMFKR